MPSASRAIVALALAILMLPVVPVHGQVTVPDPYDAALDRAVDYLAANGLTGNEYLVEAVIGAGIDPGLWPTPETNILDRLTVPFPGEFNDPIREIHAVAQSGYDPYNFQGRDLVADLGTAWDSSIQGVGQAAFTLLALHAAGVQRGDPLMEQVIEQLQRAQFASGGWTCWGLPSPDCTGFALVALASEDAFLPGTAERARLWLDANRLTNGGYASGGHIGSLTVAGVSVLDAEGANTQSTIWAVSGYRAIGDPAPPTTMAYLLSRQMPDGGFAWRDTDSRSDPWATMEVVAGWTQSFDDLPVFADDPVAVPDQSSVGVPVPLEIPGFDDVTWLDLTNTGTPLVGPAVEMTFPQEGSTLIHVDARRPGEHRRQTIDTLVVNAEPTFLDLPTEISVARHGEWTFVPQTADADGHASTVAWSFQGTTGTGEVVATSNRRGDYPLELVVSDGYGGSTSATVVVHVTK